MGTGTSGFRGSSNQTRKMGVRGITALYQYGFDNGLNFWDTADGYGSHPHLASALKHIPRDKVTIMTKSQSKTAAEMRADIERFRKELNTDYIDLLLLHAVREEDWPTQRAGAMEVVNEYKQKGIIRSRGISCHSLPALKQVHKQDYIDVDLARINPVGAKMDADPATVVEELAKIKAAGKGVIGMKILGEGALRHRGGLCAAACIGAQVRRLLHDRRREPGRARGPGQTDPGSFAARLAGVGRATAETRGACGNSHNRA